MLFANSRRIYLYFITLAIVNQSSCLANEGLMAKNSPNWQQFQGDGIIFVLVQPLVYRIKNTKKIIVVPSGFVTDFASVPWYAQSIISVLGKHSVPAVIHDYLYWEQKCTRIEADNIFYTAMEEYSTSWFQRHAVYDAVRLGGGRAWDQNAEDRRRGFPRIVPQNRLPLPANAVWAEYRQQLFGDGVRADSVHIGNESKPNYCQ
jgi:hypothetical protein